MSYTPPPPPPPPGPGYGGYGYAAPQTNKKAVWALVTGILSIVCCGPLGIVAIILGRGAEREIAFSGGAQTGAGMAKAGFVLGIVGLALAVLSAILYATGAISFNTFDTTQ
jgi:hypothetical protein